MDLVVSIGNSNIRFAIRINGRVENHRISLVSCNDIGKIGEAVFSSFSENVFDDCVLSSVNPRLTEDVGEIIQPFVRKKITCLKLGDGFMLDYSLYDAARLGLDRAICCEAAMKLVKSPFIVIDFGTATTINVVDHAKRFLGGMILPGVDLGLAALGNNTALLPIASPGPEAPLIGRNTEECILSGAVRGAAVLVDNTIPEIWLRLGEKGSVVITGGSAENVRQHIKSSHIHSPNLIIDGLFTIKDRINRKNEEE